MLWETSLPATFVSFYTMQFVVFWWPAHMLCRKVSMHFRIRTIPYNFFHEIPELNYTQDVF
ncbi:hypothetical protein NC651_008044 [Populus alba x Populus x berolinensis]|nr:hypothetical protein NC651_008044 [Populus alba x Populus x berolinensis]